ncbi:MAG: hypothetical protein ACWGSD_13615, partial [Thermodesulfobacteriota bacterium]
MHPFLLLYRLQEITKYLKGGRAVEVVRVDHGKGCADRLPARRHCVGCAPGFNAILRNREAFRQ